MTAIAVVLLVFLGLAAGSLVVLAVARSLRERSSDVPSAAELARARRWADARAFREAELDELRSQGPLIDRDEQSGLQGTRARA